jgi:translation initiation factor IF-1
LASLFIWVRSVGSPETSPLKSGCRLIDSTMEEHIEVEGRIFSVLAGTMFRVELDNKHQVLATISGKMRKRFVRLTVGDRVKMEMSPYDLNKARIVWRLG